MNDRVKELEGLLRAIVNNADSEPDGDYLRDAASGSVAVHRSRIEAARAALSQQAEPVEFDWPKLEKPAQVGAGTFCVGVSTRQVVEAAQRLYQYEQDPPFSKEQIAPLRGLLQTELAPAQYSDVISTGGMDPRNEPAPAQDEREAIPSVRDCMRRAGYEDYHGRIAFKVGQFERFVEMIGQRAIALARPAQTEQQPIGYTTAGMLAIAKELPLTGHIVVRCRRDELWNEPVFAAPIAQTAPQPEQSGPSGKCWIEVIGGREGPSLYIGDGAISHRLAGNKPWGGGTTLHRFTVDIQELVREATALAAQGGSDE